MHVTGDKIITITHSLGEDHKINWAAQSPILINANSTIGTGKWIMHGSEIVEGDIHIVAVGEIAFQFAK